MPYIVTIERRNGSETAGVVRNTPHAAFAYIGTISKRALRPLTKNNDYGDMDGVRIHIREAIDARNGMDDATDPIECIVEPKGKPTSFCPPIPVINGVPQVNGKTVQVVA